MSERRLPQLWNTVRLLLIDIDAFVFQNDIPVFSPALTDGSLGDMIYFHSYQNPGLVLDIVEGQRQGGLCVHHHLTRS